MEPASWGLQASSTAPDAGNAVSATSPHITKNVSSPSRPIIISQNHLLSPHRSRSNVKYEEREVGTDSYTIQQGSNSPSSSSIVSSQSAKVAAAGLSARRNGVRSPSNADRQSEPAQHSLSGEVSPRVEGEAFIKRSARPFSLLQTKAAQNAETADAPPSPSSARSGQSALGNHLIPTRRSSLRQSPRDKPILRDSPHSPKRFSISSREMKDADITPGLTEEDSSAIRRIQELQEAKEKRQREWRRESRHRDKQKRNSMPSPKLVRDQIPDHNTKPIVGVLMEVPDKENAKLTGIPARQIRPIIPQSVSDSRLELPKRLVLAGADPLSRKLISEGEPQIPLRHRRGISSTLKKSVTMTSINNSPSETAEDVIGEEVDAFLASPRFTQKIKHPRTGRIIAFSEVGDVKGFPVVCCVGMGLTRYVTAFYDELAKSLRLRLITPDRPGVGESEPCTDGRATPLGWADDLYVLCSALEITKFSLLAHSAGAIYALATALRLPQHVRGRLYLLAPWVPPSQMSSMSSSKLSAAVTDVPFGQKMLSVLPTSFLRIANASFMSATSASISPRTRAKRRSTPVAVVSLPTPNINADVEPHVPAASTTNGQFTPSYQQAKMNSRIDPYETKLGGSLSISANTLPTGSRRTSVSISPSNCRQIHNETLSHRIWDLATTNANPATDLVVCLERRAPIGFQYTDVARGVVIYHGENDTRVPVDNVRSLGQAMQRAEVRILPHEGHGLMASATVMSNVLGEIEKEWSNYDRVVRGHTTQSNSSLV